MGRNITRVCIIECFDSDLAFLSFRFDFEAPIDRHGTTSIILGNLARGTIDSCDRKWIYRHVCTDDRNNDSFKQNYARPMPR